MREQLEKFQIVVGTSKALGIFLEEQLITEEKLRKFVKQQLEEKDTKIISLEKQLKEEKVARNWAEKEWRELGTHWMQTSIELEALKSNFNDCQEKDEMSLGT